MRLRRGALPIVWVLLAAVPARGGLPTAAIDDWGWIAQDEPVTFSVTGDAPYGDNEIPVFQQQLADHNSYSPSEFFVHVGDIISGSTPCDEYRYEQMADMLQTLAVPAYIIPGDNETTDCSDPAQAWIYWTRHLLGIEAFFCGTPPTARQSGRTENFAFTRNGVLFVGINLVASGNSSALMQDDAAWFAEQIQTHGPSVRAAVLFSQSGPGGNRALFFDSFAATAGAWGKPVLLVHGDGHSFIQDQPFPQSNIVRVQVDRGNKPPLQVTVGMGSQNPWQLNRNPWPDGTPVLNRPPCVDAGPNRNLPGPATITLDGDATDDGDPSGTLSVQWSQVSGPAGVGFGSPASTTTTASFGVTGSYTLRLTASDGALQASDDVVVTVGEFVNEPPVALGDAYTTEEDVALTVGAPGVLANDVDPDGDPLGASVVVPPQHGTVNLAGNGGFTYTPEADYSGPDSFVYQASDGRGGFDQATVDLDVFAVNDAPVAADDFFETEADTPLHVAAPGVLSNDGDVENDPLLVSLAQGALHGTVQLSPDGSFSYVPDPSFAGYDEFHYVATDGVAASSAATVTLAVGIRTFIATADATVRSNQARKNFGDDAALDVRGGPKPYRSYVQFQVEGLDTIRFARLRLYVNGGADPGELYRVANHYSGSGDAWLESGITWENAPPLEGQPLDVWDAADDGSWVELDVTDSLVENGVYSFALHTDSSSGAAYSSREGSQPPRLLVASISAPPKPPDRQELAESPVTRVGPGEHGLRAVLPLSGKSGARIEYEVGTAARVRADLFDARGRRVRRLLDATQSSGPHSLTWDGSIRAGAPAAASVYFLRFEIGPRVWTRKIVRER